MNKKGSGSMLVLVIVVVLILGLGGYLIFINNGQEVIPSEAIPDTDGAGAQGKTFTSKLGGFTINYPSNWVASGFEGLKSGLNENSDVIGFYSIAPSRDAVNGDYLCVEFRFDTVNDRLLTDGSEIAIMDNGLTLYQKKGDYAGKEFANLYLTNKDYNNVVDLPNGNKLLASATFNCVGGDGGSLRLNYDQQLQSEAYKQAIEIFKSVTFN